MICLYSDRDKANDRNWPKGTAEGMHVQLHIFENTICEMYQRMLRLGTWPGNPLEEIPGKGVPHVHDIVERMGCMPNAEEFKEMCKAHGRAANLPLPQTCKIHETVGFSHLRDASGVPCSGCRDEKADRKKESQSPSQAASNLTTTIEVDDAAKFQSHPHIEQQSLSHPKRPCPYPTPETGEHSAANSVPMSRQPSGHVPNSHGNPMDMNGQGYHNSGLADLNHGTNFGFPSPGGYNNMEQGLRVISGVQHSSNGTHTAGINQAHVFGNPATHSGPMDSPYFDFENTTFGPNAPGIDPMHFEQSPYAHGPSMVFRNQGNPFMGQPVIQGMSPQMRGRVVHTQYMGITDPARSSTNRPTGATSPVTSENNRHMGALENIDRMPLDLQPTGNNFGASHGIWGDDPNYPQFYLTDLEELVAQNNSSQEDTKTMIQK